MRQITIIGLVWLAVAGALLNGCSVSTFRASKEISRFSEHIADAPLRIETRNGSVEVREDAEASEVHVFAKVTCGGRSSQEAQTRLAQTVLALDRGTDRMLTIRPVFPEPALSGDGARIVVRLPGSAPVTIRTSNGTATVIGLDSPMDVQTSNGRITIRGQSGDAVLRTSNGSISVEDHDGLVDAKSSNGSIRIKDHLGSVKAQSSNGSIEIEQLSGGAAPFELRTSNGSIRISLSSDFSGKITMNTSNAGIRVDDQAGVVRERKLLKTRGQLVIGTGGAASTISTSNARIELTVRAGESTAAPE